MAVPEHDEAAAQAGATWWTAAGEVDGVGFVSARLTALHADAGRQAFEARELRAHGIGDAAGQVADEQPFWLEIEVRPGAGVATGLDLRSTRVLDLRSTRVLDARGVALSVPTRANSARADDAAEAAADPYATLLEAPRAIAAGQRTSLVLVGRIPGDDARIVCGNGLELALTRRLDATETPDQPIARIDRRNPAASTEPSASEAPETGR